MLTGSILLVSSEVASNRYIIYVISLQQTLSKTASLCFLNGGSYRQVVLFSSVSSDSVCGQRISRSEDLAFTQTEFGFLVETACLWDLIKIASVDASRKILIRLCKCVGWCRIYAFRFFVKSLCTCKTWFKPVLAEKALIKIRVDKMHSLWS